MWEAKLLLLLWLSQAALSDDDWDNAGQLPQRILELIAAYNARGALQLSDVTTIRALHEESYQFEMGYVMSEILERYRQMVGLAQREEKFKMDSLFETIKHTELIQKLFFEIFHLVNMFHEISRKYSHAPSEEDQIKKILERQKEIDSIRKIEKKKRMKQLKKDREMFKKQGKVMDKKDRKPGNRWWPIDYGWEVDYQWW